ncbi:MAG TPA: protein phosphatase 2C domain-containing protein [Pyrinomonadaceae bacterium]
MTAPRKTTNQPVKVRQFLLPKQGHDLTECEDAIGVNETLHRFAVADGATEAFDAGSWARRLAHSWVHRNEVLTRDEFWQWLTEEGHSLADSWKGQQLSWYSEAKQRSGSFAAFVGVELDANAHWTAIALGDCCLIQIRADEIVESFPLSKTTDFGSAPILAPSLTAANSHALAQVVIKSGTTEPGDELLLLSDAIAAWFLTLHQQGNAKIKALFAELVASGNTEPLVEFLELQRSSGHLKNDDIAIVSLVI